MTIVQAGGWRMPRLIDLRSAGKGLRGGTVESGIDIDAPKIESSSVVMCHYYSDSLEDFMAAFSPHAEELRGDIANYTNVEPTIQISEVHNSNQVACPLGG